MSQLWLFALRNLRARVTRTLLTMGGIVMGVAVILAIEITNQSILDSIETSFNEASGQAHLTVESASLSDRGFDQRIVRRVVKVEGVQRALPVLQARSLLASEADRWHLDVAFGRGVAVGELLLYGIDPAFDREGRDYEIVAGHFLTEDDGYSLLLVDEYAAAHDIELGQEVAILAPRGRESLKVVGLIAKSGPGRLNNGDIGFLPLTTAQELFERGRNIDRVDVVAVPAVADSSRKLEALRASLRQQLGPDFNVLFPASRGQLINQMLANYRFGLSFFSTIALFVGAFLVYNTFAMTVMERTREIGLLRCLGLSRGQVAFTILQEAIILGVSGSILGLLGGLALARSLMSTTAALTATGITSMTMPVSGLVGSLMVGSVVTLASTLVPAYQAGRITPLQAVRIRGRGQVGWLIRYGWVPGAILIVLAAIGIYFPLDWDFPVAQVCVFILFLGATLCLPVVFNPLQSLFVPLLAFVYGNEGRLGGSNIQRARGRTTLTVATLMVGVTMIISLGGLTTSLRSDINRWLVAAIGGDLYVRSPIPMRANLGRRFASLPGVEAVAPTQFFAVKRAETFGGEGDEDILVFIAIEPYTYTRVASFMFASGQGDEKALIDRLAQNEAVFISSVLADKYNLWKGDTIRLRTRRGQHDFYIAGVVVDFTADGYVLYGTWMDMRRYFGLSKADAFIVKLASAGSYQAVKETLEDRYGQRRHIQVEDSRAFRERITKTTNRAFALFDVLVSIGMVVAALGVLNTLLMNILERTREIGSLRSLGMTRGQVARMILAEAGTMGAIGALLGLGMGLVLSRLFVRAMNQLSNYNLAYVFPTNSLIAGLGIALVVSQLAALYPAWRAARLRIVEAIQHE